MSELERHISRYLDREMSADEERSFLRSIDADPIARETLRRMEEVRTVARLFPTLTAPSSASESRLFTTLFAEEDGGRRRAAAVPPVGRDAEEPTERRRRGLAAVRFDRMMPALLALLLIGAGLAGIDRLGSGESDGTAGPAIAATTPGNTAPGTSPLPTGSVESLGVESVVESVSAPTSGARPARGVSSSRTASQEQENVDAAVPVPVIDSTTTQPVPFAAIDTPTSPADPIIDSAPNPATEIAEIVPPQLPYIAEDPSRSDRTERSRFAGSLHFGVATFSDGAETMMAAQDMNLRVDGHLGDRHRVSVVVGNAPILVSGTQTSMPTGISDEKDEKGQSVSGGIRVDDFSRSDHEMWAGVGYGYAVYQTKALSLEAGINLGAGEHSLRVGLELPARIRVADRISIDVVPFVNRVTPYDQDRTGREIDRYTYIEEETPTITSFGAQLGISFDIGE